MLAGVAAAGVPSGFVQLDVAIARGLDYYTGTIYETFLNDLPTIGSVCSGGRYDNLTGLYTSQQLPGIGASLGLDRLLAGLEELGCSQKSERRHQSLSRSSIRTGWAITCGWQARIRSGWNRCRSLPGREEARSATQVRRQSRGFTLAIVAGDQEFAANTVQVKNLKTTNSVTVSLADENGLESTLAELLK